MDNVLASFFAPITLLLGGALVALGFLSFLDLNFFKTKLRAKVAFAAGLAFLFATEAMFSPAAAPDAISPDCAST